MIRIAVQIETDTAAEAAAVVADLHRLRLAAHVVNDDRPHPNGRHESRRHLRAVGDT